MHLFISVRLAERTYCALKDGCLAWPGLACHVTVQDDLNKHLTVYIAGFTYAPEVSAVALTNGAGDGSEGEGEGEPFLNASLNSTAICLSTFRCVSVFVSLSL